jgi:DNA-binding CsgD family transcriptional regulator/phage shock protein A
VTPKYHFQWQHPDLSATIYPFREAKLRDFLLYYREIDLMKTLGKQAVPPALAQEILGERQRLQGQIDSLRSQISAAEAQIKTIQQQHRALLSNPDVRKLQYGVQNQKAKLASAQTQLNSKKNRRDWYEKFAPDHPYFVRYDTEYQAYIPVFQEIEKELQAAEARLHQILAPYETQTQTLRAQVEQHKTRLQEHTARLNRLPAPDKQGKITPQAAVRWELLKYEEALQELDQARLIQAILERFIAEPGRFPRWLQYMVIHFSGMRYKSAHGSWADPRELLESLETERVRQNLAKLPAPEVEKLSQQAISRLELQKKQNADPRLVRQVDLQISGLKNPFQRLRMLEAIQGEEAEQSVAGLSEAQVLERLKGWKNELPAWAWKEIVARTNLRLEEAQDENWEKLTPQEQQQRWDYESRHWNMLMNAWINQDITSWRKAHERTLSLVVTRAVCNEIAEHIQHLRGLKPAGGLTARPNWYLRAQAAQPGKAYFRRPVSAQDFKPGASILFLGWVDREPNAWQIAHPLPGIDLAPQARQEKKARTARADSEEWRYRLEGNRFIRTSRPLVEKQTAGPPRPGKPPKTRLVRGPEVKHWLRWTHEATVVEVAEMTDGWNVLTFETGQIGIIRRPLGRLVNTWDVFVGYIPEGQVDRAQVAKMLDPKLLLPAELLAETLPAPAAPAELAFTPPELAAAPAELAFTPPELAAAPPELSFTPQEPSFAPPELSFTPQEPSFAPPELSSTPQEPSFAPPDLAGGVPEKPAGAAWAGLTPRQKQVAAHWCAGQSVRQIASELGTSASTIYTHLRNIRLRLGLRRREEICPALGGVDLAPWRVKSMHAEAEK